MESGQEREKFLAELRLTEVRVPQVVELKRTVQVLQEHLGEEEGEHSKAVAFRHQGTIPS